MGALNSSDLKDGLSSAPPGSDITHYTVPFSVNVQDAHSILYGWLETMNGEHYEREHFHIAKMNKKYYGCWLFWFIVPEGHQLKEEESVPSSSGTEAGKRKKLIIIPGSPSVPAQLGELSKFYDYMELCMLDEKISTSSEFASITVPEKNAFDEALKRLGEEEPSLFDERGILSPEVNIQYKVPIALPLWEGAYDYRGGRECLFFIDGQKGKIIGEKFTQNSRSHIFKYVPYIAGALLVLLIVLIVTFVPFGGDTKRSPEPTKSIAATDTPSHSPESSPSFATGTTTESPSFSPAPEPSVSSSPDALSSPSLENEESLKVKEIIAENFKAISRKDFTQVLSLRTEMVKSSKSVSEYRAIYKDNISIDLVDSSVSECTETEARINVTLLSRDSFEGKEEDSTYKGWFLLRKENGQWRIQDSDISKTNRDTTNRDATDSNTPEQK
ncbi:MAG: hypothetical protein AB9903_33710 [Vulcanimicrobiota bacterium]